ncbi:hypothetical protein Emin_0919 [Elusimicrobium minutum Pei191]|uniref:Lipoprotein n=1 Tax=Elusimicrobium minutum (strain Pei191) TaxID=445932 RepID=B2KD76_ELUMP|nr:hypothetical protein [Elusimicrobium minutum]ACC98472.1 hypothetical protein Emin_0919 [Elusimicrobium minutum Pei191]
MKKLFALFFVLVFFACEKEAPAEQKDVFASAQSAEEELLPVEGAVTCSGLALKLQTCEPAQCVNTINFFGTDISTLIQIEPGNGGKCAYSETMLSADENQVIKTCNFTKQQLPEVSEYLAGVFAPGAENDIYGSQEDNPFSRYLYDGTCSVPSTEEPLEPSCMGGESITIQEYDKSGNLTERVIECSSI